MTNRALEYQCFDLDRLKLAHFDKLSERRRPVVEPEAVLRQAQQPQSYPVTATRFGSPSSELVEVTLSKI